jgi:hypothetical protein
MEKEEEKDDPQAAPRGQGAAEPSQPANPCFSAGCARERIPPGRILMT